MIKKIPYTHMVRYLLAGISLAKDSRGEDILTAQDLNPVLTEKFKFSESKAKKLAEFLTDSGPVSRRQLILRIQEHVNDYKLITGMQLAYMIGQLANMADGKQEDIFDDLNLEDEDNIGVLTFDQIMRYWKYSGLPVLNEEMIEFLQYMAMRFSRSLNKVRLGKPVKLS